LFDERSTGPAPEALLFDLDGVLANVENSYRRCTLETVRSFGVQVERQDLERAVLAGDANNDWILTQRFLNASGVQVSFDKVYERYQEFYLGTEDRPGLRETETLLVEPDLLRQLSEQLKLAVVTGRPRAEAEWFLERAGVRDYFESVVCLEDGPNKPDPTPVRVALERLGVSSAWMIGDTPDDIRAAAAAGVLPIGIIAPGADVAANSAALEEAGAVTILDSVDSILEFLPNAQGEVPD
jgi:HAD superfamily phosphatase